MKPATYKIGGEPAVKRLDNVEHVRRGFTAIVIRPTGPFEEVELAPNGNLDRLQKLVGGYIEAVPLPEFISGSDQATSYVNEEGKFDLEANPPNLAATDFMVPGVGLMPSDFIAGTFVVAGFDPDTGEHDVIPSGVMSRLRTIARESGRGWA